MPEQRERSGLELNGYFGAPLGKALAMSQIERYARPPPVIHEEPLGYESLGHRVAWHAFLLPVTGHGLAKNSSRPVLAAHHILGYLCGGKRLYRPENLGFLVAHRLRLEGSR